jgi:lysophospholipid acyltransferase (LPLAT)-like uncharacterized protein
LVGDGGINHLALTPDGPRGPRRQVQRGLIYLAAKTGLAIVTVGFGLHRPWRANSWDRFAIPRPWSRARCVTGVPVFVPPEAIPAQLELYRIQVENQLAMVTRAAEDWAATGNRSNLVALQLPRESAA